MAISLHVRAVERNAVPPLRSQRLVRVRRAVAADHLDLGAGPPEGNRQIPEQIQEPRVVRPDLAVAIVAQDFDRPGSRATGSYPSGPR